MLVALILSKFQKEGHRAVATVSVHFSEIRLVASRSSRGHLSAAPMLTASAEKSHCPGVYPTRGNNLFFGH